MVTSSGLRVPLCLFMWQPQRYPLGLMGLVSVAEQPAAVSVWHPCSSRQCDRVVLTRGAFCCAPCGKAWESGSHGLGVHGHSDGCDARARERASRLVYGDVRWM